HGYRNALPFAAALWLGEVLWLTLAVYGLAAIAETFYVAFTVIKYLGVAYLLYLAWHMWFAPCDIPADAVPRERSPLKMFVAGVAVTLGNPKVMVFYMALLPTIVDLHTVGSWQWAELAVVAVAVLMATDLSWVGLASRARTLLRSRRAVRAANRTSAT